MKTIVLFFLITNISSLNAKVLRVIGGKIESVFGDNTGLEELILNRVFKCMQQDFNLTIVPFGRHTKFFNDNDDYDAVATVPNNTKLSGYRSDSHITYYNGITTLTKKKL